MSKHEKYTRLKRQIALCLVMGAAMFSAAPMAFAATSVIANNTLPSGGHSLMGNHTGLDSGTSTNPTMNIHQTGQNGVITWESFNVGGSATVNFTSNVNNFNTLNYVTSSGSISQIYGTINANLNGNKGNIYIVNPAGVQIGNSAQINVGSLYVSTNTLDDTALKNFYINAGTTGFQVGGTPNADAELMSLGNINATNVTFEGNGRIVIDSERIKNDDGEKLDNFTVKTNNAGNVIIGYDAYNTGDTKGTYEGKDHTFTNVEVDGTTTNVKGYMWVEDVEQLQAIDTNLGGNYALRNSIDATATSDWSDAEHDTTAEGFKSIGVGTDGKVAETTVDNEIKYGFYGNFDGLDYNIFGLTINREDTNNVGLFGVAHDANINNVTLVGGTITGDNVVGSIVGAALGNTHVNNATNSTAVTGHTDVGGIVGASGNEIITNGNNGKITVTDTKTTFTNLINTGSITSDVKNSNTLSSNVGGLIGYMYNGTLQGNSYNLGNVSGDGYNVGGLVGHALNSKIGDGTNLVYNVLDVTGAYNVGGIVGNMENSTVQIAENSGTILAKGYTTEDYTYHSAHYTNNENYTVSDVHAANVGGIVGISSNNGMIQNVTNNGDVSSYKEAGNNFYNAGNVGGVVGKAIDTNITTATNRENEIRGAHNVGGIAGYFGNSNDDSNGKDYTVAFGINDGGDIMATGARKGDTFVLEWVRAGTTGGEETITGNMGGVIGYMDGDNVYVTSSANRGTVHSLEITGTTVSDASKASNTGGIVGKLDRNDTAALEEIQDGTKKAAVADSYNTGDVRGYMGVGGVVGMMYNGEISGSYNLGAINTTRQPGTASESYYSVNMGGIVGDTTEGTTARALLFDVYNKGQIGDENYIYYARHVGGIVGRLSGIVNKAYNTGSIYNGYNVVGGIVGWMYTGSITNAFNTGNITVVNNEKTTAGSQVGGIAGAASVASGNITIHNVYNLGTLRSFQNAKTAGENVVGGIIGMVSGNSEKPKNEQHTIRISNAYTTGNIYTASISDDGKNFEENTKKETTKVGSIYGDLRNNLTEVSVDKENTYYIKPDTHLSFTDLSNAGKDNSNKAINYADRAETTAYQYTDDGNVPYGLIFTTQEKGDVINAADDNWRIYGGNTPILNAFLPNAEGYFSDDEHMNGIGSIQYGTAYDPLLTIIQAANGTNELQYNWTDLGLSNAAGLAVYGAGLTLNDVVTSGGSGYFGGVLYSDGALNLNSTNDLGFGSAAELYGSSVNIQTDGELTIYGSVTATGNNGATEDDDDTIKVDNPGNITIQAGDVTVYGQLTSAKKDQQFSIPGIEGTAVETWKPGNINDPNESMMTIGDRFAHEVTSSATGNIIINAGTKEIPKEDGTTETVTIGTGNVNLYYGNKEEGLITAGGNLTVNATGDVYVDSDLSIGGDLALESSGETSEVLLDITNIGQVQGTNALEGLDTFLDHFQKDSANSITLAAGSNDAKITVDMWDYEKNQFDLNKFKYDGEKLADRLNSLDATATIDGGISSKNAQDFTYIWVNTIEQQQGIQEYARNTNSDFLTYNFALKDDVNASKTQNYEAIGTDIGGYTGKFDGRGNRIIGLNTTGDNAGIFSQIGADGTVKNVNIYSGNFSGTSAAGAVAGTNSGTIENVTTFGNTVTVNGNGNVGGIVGSNTGTVDDVEAIGSVIAENGVAAGGLVGTNEGTINYSYSNSAVTGTADGLGGVAGINKGDVQLVDSLGVTNGDTTGKSNIGGIIGVNNGNMYSGYNESIVSGQSNVGGIIGENTGKYENDTWTGGTVENVVNATRVESNGDNVGGLIGSNSGNVTNGRNNGEITGNQYVGGLVGSNEADSTLTNLVNDSSASITGEMYVGGIAGSNAGTITAMNEDTEEGSDTLLINRGTITGQQYVGGVAGVNKNGGRIENTNNDVELFVKDSTKPAQYFGGVAGVNENGATIGNATNTADVNADGASYVGGVVGLNKGTLENMAGNTGNVTGKDFVGGVAGRNESEISGVIAENSGFVTATDGGAGGIFAVNTKDITNSWFSSKGEVSGKKDDDQTVYGTGGIFGVNEGDISGSVLENIGYTDEDGEYQDSFVTGDSNTGGLIGYNKGSVTESTLRNEANIKVDGEVQNIGGLIGYNEGQITGGRDAQNSYYKYQIYNTGTIKVTGNGTNIGGLFGTNIGKVTAAYNTGAIEARTSTNVGGIAGSNTSTLDQVFNTVIAGVDSETGSTTLYGSIAGGKNVGGLVGWNSDTGNLQNAYNTTKVEGLTTYGNAVGNNAGDICNIYATNSDGTLVGQNDKLIENSYSFSAEDKGIMGITVLDVDAQKKGDSYTSFADFDKTWRIYDDYSNPLLKVFLTTLTIDADKVGDMTYNAEDQNLALGTLVGNAITAPTADLSKGENGNDTPKHDAFNGLDAYYSTINSNDPYYKGDSFLLGNTDDQVNKGDYANWLFSQQIAASNTKENAGTPVLGYDIVYTNTGADTGLKINALTLDISLDDIYRTYGDVANIFSDSDRKKGTNYDQSYSIEGYDSWSQKLKGALGTIIVEKKEDGSLLSDDKTQKVGPYDWSATVTLSNTSGNFQLNDTGATSVELTGVGKAHVEKAELNFGAQDVTINLGDKPIYTASQEPNFVNGDVFDIDYGVSNVNSSLESTVGTHEDIIGFWYNGQFYDGDSAGLSQLFGGNYNVTFTPADLTVKEKVAPTYPDIPAWEFPGGRWDYLYSDAPFDRNKDFRERKAEINFVDGGMEL